MKFWEFKNKSKDVGELYLYGEISSTPWFGDEITPKTFKSELDALGEVKNLDIYINSPGGDVFAGYAMKAMLDRHSAEKTVYVDGIAASIATIFFGSANKVVMAENSMAMVHKCWSIVAGNVKEIIKQTEIMGKIDDTLSEIFQKLTGKTKEDIDQMLDDEKWMTAKEAVEMGFAHEIAEGKKIAACLKDETLEINGQKFDVSRFSNREKLTETYRAEPTPEPVVIPDAENLADEPDLSEQRKQIRNIQKKIYGGTK